LRYSKRIAVQSKDITVIDFKTPIWIVHPHPTLPILIVELRDNQTRTVDFTLIDLRLKIKVWEGLNPQDDWWSGVEIINEKYLILYGFEDANNPVRKGLYVYKLDSKELVYSQSEAVFEYLNGDILYCRITNEAASQLYKVDLTNLKIESINDFTIQNLQSENHLEIPVFFSPEDVLFGKILQVCGQYISVENAVAIEYLEYNQFACVVVTLGTTNVGQQLLVIDDSGKLILSETIAQNLKGISLGTFFISHGYLVFVKDYSKLHSFQLQEKL
jgi:hypothetical protein